MHALRLATRAVHLCPWDTTARCRLSQYAMHAGPRYAALASGCCKQPLPHQLAPHKPLPTAPGKSYASLRLQPPEAVRASAMQSAYMAATSAVLCLNPGTSSEPVARQLRQLQRMVHASPLDTTAWYLLAVVSLQHATQLDTPAAYESALQSSRQALARVEAALETFRSPNRSPPNSPAASKGVMSELESGAPRASFEMKIRLLTSLSQIELQLDHLRSVHPHDPSHNSLNAQGGDKDGGNKGCQSSLALQGDSHQAVTPAARIDGSGQASSPAGEDAAGQSLVPPRHDGSLERALDLARRAVDCASAPSTPQQQVAVAQRQLGRVLSANGNRGAAAEAYRRAISCSDLCAVLEYARLLQSWGTWAQAAELLEQERARHGSGLQGEACCSSQAATTAADGAGPVSGEATVGDSGGGCTPLADSLLLEQAMVWIHLGDLDRAKACVGKVRRPHASLKMIVLEGLRITKVLGCAL